MLPHRQLIKLTSRSGDNQPQVKSPRLRALLIWALVGMLTLACGGLGTRAGVDKVTILTRLPTLTRTPLPTLTPTPNATQVAMALAAEATLNEVAPQPTAGEANTYAPQAATVPEAGATSSDSASSVPQAPVINDAAAQQSQAGGAVLTNTPLLPPTETATPLPTNTPEPTATDAPTPTETPTPSPTVPPLPEGWVFQGVRFTSAESLDMQGLLFFGELINNTGTTQNLARINCTYYDTGGQKIPYASTNDYVPIATIPQGGQVPFELIAEDLHNMASFDLEVVAEPGQDAPRQDFEFLEVTSSPDGPKHCITGQLRNPGQSLSNYLKMAAVLYDSQDQVINFGYSQQAAPAELVGEQTLAVNFCVDRDNQEVARYELRAWGL